MRFLRTDLLTDWSTQEGDFAQPNVSLEVWRNEGGDWTLVYVSPTQSIDTGSDVVLIQSPAARRSGPSGMTCSGWA